VITRSGAILLLELEVAAEVLSVNTQASWRGRSRVL